VTDRGTPQRHDTFYLFNYFGTRNQSYLSIDVKTRDKNAFGMLATRGASRGSLDETLARFVLTKRAATPDTENAS
jgi:hypothetical protein